MENTTNLKLPLLIPNQSGKEITHNEALVIIDNILQNGVIDKDLTTPPENPNSNDIYIVGKNATGDWADKDKQIAFYDNGWRFVEPREGFIFWVNDEDKLYTYNGSKWVEAVASSGSGNTGGTSDVQELNDLLDVEITSAGKYDILQHDGTDFVNTKSLQQLTMLGINATADSDNKLSVKSDYVLFDKSTDNSRVKVNKATSTDTASHLFQTNYGGRAEFGLIGNDDFTLKVSSDGETWNNAFVVDGTTGNVDFKGTITNNGSSIGGGSSSMAFQTTDSTKVGYCVFYPLTQHTTITLPSGGTFLVHMTSFHSTALTVRAVLTQNGIFAGGTTFVSDQGPLIVSGFALKIAE